jgi:hypothetical protein
MLCGLVQPVTRKVTGIALRLEASSLPCSGDRSEHAPRLAVFIRDFERCAPDIRDLPRGVTPLTFRAMGHPARPCGRIAGVGPSGRGQSPLDTIGMAVTPGVSGQAGRHPRPAFRCLENIPGSKSKGYTKVNVYRG